MKEIVMADELSLKAIEALRELDDRRAWRTAAHVGVGRRERTQAARLYRRGAERWMADL
jgi:hypothetical protein